MAPAERPRLYRPATDRRGSDLAKLFRAHRCPKDGRRCDLDAVLEEDEIETIDFETSDPGCSALLWRPPGASKGGGIMLPPADPPQRRRFSIAHELGHFHIPGHRDVHGGCTEGDLRARGSDARQQEWQANDFAVELLMPYSMFAPDIRGREITIATVEQLAAGSMYDVSLLACARRIVAVTRERAALVISKGGRVSWVIRSAAFDGAITERGQPLKGETLASSIFRGAAQSSTAQPVSCAAWFDDERSAASSDVLLESAYSIGPTEEIVSLLWRPEPADEGVGFDERS